MDRASKKLNEELSVFGANIEDNVVGTWFARLGVLALLIGAAFGYRYAVDQGLIGPEARVALGVVSGVALIGWGHIARRNGWLNFAHALSGGGVAIAYLSVFAAQYRFDLISPALALALLSGVALLSAWLAIGYNSLPLAVLATLGAFMNPYFMAADDPTSALSYLVGVNLGVVCLAFHKHWPSLNKLALVGTAIITAIVVDNGTGIVEGLGFTTVFWMLFTLIPFVQAARDDAKVHAIDAGLVVSGGSLYLVAGLFFLERDIDQGVFALVVGGAYAVLAYLAYSDDRTRTPLATVMAMLSIGFITLAAPLMTDGPMVHLLWSVEGAVLLYAGGVMNDTIARVTAGALIVVGLLGTIQTMSTYTPDRLLLSDTSIVIGIEILVLFATAWLIGRVDRSGDWEPTVQIVLVTASLLAIGWLSQEARYEVARSVPADEVFGATQFALSAVWATCATVLVAAGVAARQRWARYLGLGVFVFTLVKMVSVDLWLLEILQRTVAFVGLGVLMIGCSFMYNRFRTLIVGES